jgi:hypothetical protein
LFRERGKGVAIVTSSPSPYARAILSLFQIPCDVLVGYYDTEAHKPDPEPLNLALQRLGCSPEECLYVGDEPSDAKAAYHAKVKSVGALWRFTSLADPELKKFWRSAPDMALLQPGTLLLPHRLSLCRYLGEASIDGQGVHNHEGYRLYWQEADGVRVECLGRYFTGSDERSSQAWTRRVLELKNNPSVGDSFVPPLAAFLNRYTWKPDFIVPVPPKPGETSRFTAILDVLPDQLVTACTPLLDGLTCLRAVDGYKGLTHEARDTAIRGTISSNYSWTGKRVLLLDDVVTSGSTTRECARTLRSDGADEVRLLGLSAAQESFTLTRCPKCGRTMKRRTRKSDGAPFWGCSGYPNHCRYTIPIDT